MIDPFHDHSWTSTPTHPRLYHCYCGAKAFILKMVFDKTLNVSDADDTETTE